MEKTGLVRRRSCGGDNRGVYAVLTSAGRSRLAQAAPGRVAEVRAVLIDVVSPQQLGHLADGLGEVAGRLAREE